MGAKDDGIRQDPKATLKFTHTVSLPLRGVLARPLACRMVVPCAVVDVLLGNVADERIRWMAQSSKQAVSSSTHCTAHNAHRDSRRSAASTRTATPST